MGKSSVLLKIGMISLVGLGIANSKSVLASENDLMHDSSSLNEINPDIVNETEIFFDERQNSTSHGESEFNNENASRMINTIRYRKKNVTNFYEWSGYRRVSDNLKTGSKGGSITTNRSTTFGATTTGNVYGIQVAASASRTSSTGYILNVGANQRVYVGYRVRYSVERGTREQYDLATGRIYSVNSYNRKVPTYGEYALIRY